MSFFLDIGARRNLLIAAISSEINPGPFMMEPYKVGVAQVSQLVKPEKMSENSLKRILIMFFTSDTADKFSEVLVANGVTEQNLKDIIAGKAKIVTLVMDDVA